MKLLSLFDGSGAFPLAAERNGIEPYAASEVEPFPIAVTRARFPEMRHLGDVTKIDGGDLSKIQPCDIVTAGFPCQDVSIAGKHKGLQGSRTSLFFDAARIVEGMLNATQGTHPKYIIFENVPGLLSSNKGDDFKTVLAELSKLGFVIDANVLDSQDFGVAQRRKRVFIVGVNIVYFRHELFEHSAEHRHDRVNQLMRNTYGCDGFVSKPHIPERVKLSDILETEFDPKHIVSAQACRGILNRADNNKKNVPEILRRALDWQGSLDGDVPVAFEPGALGRVGFRGGINVCSTLRAKMGDNSPCVAIPIENHASDSRYKVMGDTCQTLSAKMGKGGGNVPLIIEPIALTTKTPECFHNICPTLKARDYKDPTAVLDFVNNWGWIVRRLTPTECLTLQGLPKTWCDGIALRTPPHAVTD